jgi:hypothetical protein
MTAVVEDSTEVEVEPARFDRPRTSFEKYVEQAEPYFEAIRNSDDESAPWFEQPERLAAVAARLGLPVDSPAEVVRRSLFDRRHLRPTGGEAA